MVLLGGKSKHCGRIRNAPYKECTAVNVLSVVVAWPRGRKNTNKKNDFVIVKVFCSEFWTVKYMLIHLFLFIPSIFIGRIFFMMYVTLFFFVRVEYLYFHHLCFSLAFPVYFCLVPISVSDSLSVSSCFILVVFPSLCLIFTFTSFISFSCLFTLVYPLCRISLCKPQFALVACRVAL